MSSRSGETPAPVLFVCTGNTCRSPMAEGILKRRLRATGAGALRVGSAGVFAVDGSPASPMAIEVCRSHGIDIGGHRARRLTREIVAEAGIVLAMEPGHLERVRALGGGTRAGLLGAFPGEGAGAGGVEDPAGGGRTAYEAVYDRLAREIDRILPHLGGGERGNR